MLGLVKLVPLQSSAVIKPSEFWIELKQERERVGSKVAWNCICLIEFPSTID